MVKRLLLATIAALLLFWAGVCFFIPNPLQISAAAYMDAPVRTVTGIAFNSANWQRWWPGTDSNLQFYYHDYSYRITAQNPVTAQVFAQQGNDTFTVQLTILPLPHDSTVAEWKTVLPASLNPFTRISQYNHALHVKQDLQLLSDSLSAYVSNKQNIYGVGIDEVSFTNPFMISTKTELTEYPTTTKMYAVISTLREYQKAQGATAVDSPMVHIDSIGINSYLLRAALPVDKKMPGTNAIDFKQMVLGKTLVATVTGGRFRIEQALLQMQQYITDYHRTSPAIPFQLLVTNRQQQPDSSKWITKLYYPVY